MDKGTSKDPFGHLSKLAEALTVTENKNDLSQRELFDFFELKHYFQMLRLLYKSSTIHEIAFCSCPLLENCCQACPSSALDSETMNLCQSDTCLKYLNNIPEAVLIICHDCMLKLHVLAAEIVSFSKEMDVVLQRILSNKSIEAWLGSILFSGTSDSFLENAIFSNSQDELKPDSLTRKNIYARENSTPNYVYEILDLFTVIVLLKDADRRQAWLLREQLFLLDIHQLSSFKPYEKADRFIMELNLVKQILRLHPKSAVAWNYRCFIVKKLFSFKYKKSHDLKMHANTCFDCNIEKSNSDSGQHSLLEFLDSELISIKSFCQLQPSNYFMLSYFAWLQRNASVICTVPEDSSFLFPSDKERNSNDNNSVKQTAESKLALITKVRAIFAKYLPTLMGIVPHCYGPFHLLGNVFASDLEDVLTATEMDRIVSHCNNYQLENSSHPTDLYFCFKQYSIYLEDRLAACTAENITQLFDMLQSHSRETISAFARDAHTSLMWDFMPQIANLITTSTSILIKYMRLSDVYFDLYPKLETSWLFRSMLVTRYLEFYINTFMNTMHNKTDLDYIPKWLSNMGSEQQKEKIFVIQILLSHMIHVLMGEICSILVLRQEIQIQNPFNVQFLCAYEIRMLHEMSFLLLHIIEFIEYYSSNSEGYSKCVHPDFGDLSRHSAMQFSINAILSLQAYATCLIQNVKSTCGSTVLSCDTKLSDFLLADRFIVAYLKDYPYGITILHDFVNAAHDLQM